MYVCSARIKTFVASLGVVIYQFCSSGDTILKHGASVFIMLLNKHLLLSAVLFFIKDESRVSTLAVLTILKTTYDLAEDGAMCYRWTMR